MVDVHDHPTASDPVLSERQVADELGVSIGTLNEWRQLGTGPRWRQVDGQPSYRPAEVAAWLAEAACRPTVAPVSNASSAAGVRVDAAMEPAGLEPATSALQRRRSAS